jgi:hypothetical protein
MLAKSTAIFGIILWGCSYRLSPKKHHIGYIPRPYGRAGIDEEQIFGLFIVANPARWDACEQRSAAQEVSPGELQAQTRARGSPRANPTDRSIISNGPLP